EKMAISGTRVSLAPETILDANLVAKERKRESDRRCKETIQVRYFDKGQTAVSVLRIPTRRETAGKNVKDNGMCRVAHAWLRGMRPRNGTSVSHGVCHETWGLIARNPPPLPPTGASTT
ncbi:hypothetical protein ALC57_03455, partial [Trachymyrmex cornetzi]